MELLPASFLFRYAVPVAYAPDRPMDGAWPVGDDLEPLPLFSELDRPADENGETHPSIELRAAWSETGFGVSAVVEGLDKRVPVSQMQTPSTDDGLHIWIDTRNAQGVHRATRYCHRFGLFPAATDGRRKTPRPAVAHIQIVQAREASRDVDLSQVVLAADVTAGGYRVEAWFPADTLYGYDPDNIPRIGFHAVVKNRRLGDRSLTIDDQFPVEQDPDLWTTLELVRP